MSLLATLYRHAGRPLLFRLDAETAHHLATRVLRGAQESYALREALRGRDELDPCLRVRALGREFRSPIGVAAGFDKHAELYNALFALGFGSVEVGTVTAHAQPGNPRPRLFRLAQDRALLNRMGFNNDGAARVREALCAHAPEPGLVLGVNLGKSKVTPLEHAADDYAASARLLGPFAHYVVVNVSSPNTPGLRTLQSVDALERIVRATQGALASVCAQPPPLLVKIAPDLADDDIDAVSDLAHACALAGVVATNTTLARTGLETDPVRVEALGAGGVSGAPLRVRALEVMRRVYERAAGRFIVVGVGGISSAAHAWDAIAAGATLVQLYTGFVYEGPALARAIAQGLARRIRAAALPSVQSLVGTGLRDPLADAP